ncbi:MAG TPA: APC family permease [Candidatus Thermoplasmatota archaeon]|nr:APC family permease [Candidatus Thermoplasmatota archaeon]
MAELRRVLGLPLLTFYGVGLIVGAGIYSILGAAAGQAGDGVWLAFLCAAAVALLTGLSYAELAAMMPRAGAEYHYARTAFPGSRIVAPTTGLVLAASATATSATVATAFAGYLGGFVDAPALAVAAGLLVVATLVNLAGMRQAAWVNATFVLVEVGGLAAVIAVGLRPEGLGTVATLPDWGPLAAAAALVFFAFLGFEDIANLAEEAREPKRDAPRAILLAIGVSTLLYVLVALAAVMLLPAEQLGESKAPLADAVSTVDPRLGVGLAVIALFATANTALVAMVVASRILFGVSRGGDAPRPLARVLARRRTPWVAALVVLAGALLLLPLGTASLLGSVASFAALTGFCVVNVALVRLRFTQPGRARPFRVPLAIGKVPVTAVLGAAGAAAFATRLHPVATSIGIGVVLLAAGTVALSHRLGRADPG